MDTPDYYTGSITQGPAVRNGADVVVDYENRLNVVATCHPVWDGSYVDNAEFIVEAFNVARDTGASPRQLADRVEALEQALSIALQHVPLEGDDARNIYELEKSTYIKNGIPNHTQRERCAGPRKHG
jgi:hypothetical protein